MALLLLLLLPGCNSHQKQMGLEVVCTCGECFLHTYPSCFLLLPLTATVPILYKCRRCVATITVAAAASVAAPVELEVVIIIDSVKSSNRVEFAQNLSAMMMRSGFYLCVHTSFTLQTAVYRLVPARAGGMEQQQQQRQQWYQSDEVVGTNERLIAVTND